MAVVYLALGMGLALSFPLLLLLLLAVAFFSLRAWCWIESWGVLGGEKLLVLCLLCLPCLPCFAGSMDGCVGGRAGWLRV